MKNPLSLRQLVAALSVAALCAAALSSCQKDPVTAAAEQPLHLPDNSAGQYSKRLVLSESGQAALTLDISTDHAEMLNWFKVSDLMLFQTPAASEAAQEIEVGNPDNTTEASPDDQPDRLVVITLKKAERDDLSLRFSEQLQDRLNAAGATVRFVVESSDEVADRAAIGGSPRRIRLTKHQPSKPAFVYVRWRCANTYYLSTHNWAANNGTHATYYVCPYCSSATRYFYNYDYYCSASYSTVYLSWQSTACN